MKKEEKNRLIQELNRLGEQLGELDPKGNEAACLGLRDEIFITAAELFSRPEDLEALGDFCYTEWKSFDPRKGTLYNFFASRLKWRKLDLAQEDFDGRPETTVDLVTGKEKSRFVPYSSLETPVGDEDGATRAELLPDTAPAPEEELALDDTALRILLLFLDLEGHLEGRANNPVRRNYFRMFFTNGIATLLHEQDAPGVLRQRERDLFQAIKVPFLDYFMAAVCRTVDAIADSPVKPYGELVDGKGAEEAPLPLPNDVYIAYLDRVEHYHATPAAVSQQRTLFSELRRLL